MKTLFLFKDKRVRHINYLLYILLMIIYVLVIKIFHILIITALDIHLSLVDPIVLFVQVFYAFTIAHGP